MDKYTAWLVNNPASVDRNVDQAAWEDCIVRSNSLKCLVRLAGFEPATYGLEVRCSVQLSYRRAYIVKSSY